MSEIVISPIEGDQALSKPSAPVNGKTYIMPADSVYDIPRYEPLKPPKGEQIWVTCRDDKGKPTLIITSKQANRDTYFLYRVLENGDYEKVSKGGNPALLVDNEMAAVAKMKKGKRAK